MSKIRQQLGVGLQLESRSLNKGKGKLRAPGNIPSLSRTCGDILIESEQLLRDIGQPTIFNGG